MPISLLVTTESIKFFQGVRLKNTKLTKTTLKDAAGAPTGEFVPCTVQTSSLNEELGQVNFVLSDKTGTLTRNKMVFRNLIVGKKSFGEQSDVGTPAQDPALVGALAGASKERQQLFECFHCMTLCHSVVFDENMNWNSCSAEELAFLDFAALHGFVYQTPEIIGKAVLQVVNELGSSRKYKLLERFEFSSERRRMSVVVDINDDIFMYTKGADDMIHSRLNSEQSRDLESVLFQIDQQAAGGFRVMMLAFKQIERKSWFAFNLEYQKVRNDPAEAEKKLQMQDELESGLILLGACSIEDKLQDLVPESIQFLRSAGIKFWVITGDKSQTALAVAKNCKLVSDNAELLLFEDKNTVNETHVAQAWRTLKGLSKSQQPACLVHGTYLSTLFELRHVKKDLFNEFVRLIMQTDVAIFARISPRQKQEVVRMIREFDETLVTLAIGDGANDVNMISAAHVGVGLKGSEGGQAARASDYFMGEFRHLVPLVCWFGRECYRRNSQVVLFIFYKNIMVVMAQFWYGAFNFFSGQPLYEPWVYQLYNILFSFLPIFVFGIFDKSMRRRALLTDPAHYRPGSDHYFFNNTRVILQITLSFLVALYLTLTALVFFDWGSYANGWTYGFWNFGNMTYFGIVIVVNCRVVSMSSSYSVLLAIFVLTGIFCFVLIWFLASLSITNVLYNTFNEVLQGYQLWLYLVVVFGVCGLEFLISKLEGLLMQMQYVPQPPQDQPAAKLAENPQSLEAKAPSPDEPQQLMEESFDDGDRARRNLSINSDED